MICSRCTSRTHVEVDCTQKAVKEYRYRRKPRPNMVRVLLKEADSLPWAGRGRQSRAK